MFNNSKEDVVLSNSDVKAIDGHLKDGSFFPFTLDSFVHLVVSYTASTATAIRMAEIAKRSTKTAAEIKLRS